MHTCWRATRLTPPCRFRGVSFDYGRVRDEPITAGPRRSLQGLWTMASAVPARVSPSFNRLAWSNLAAQSAEQLAVAATPIVTVLVLGGGAGETGLIQTAQTLPFLFFGIPAGMLVDRMPRRSVMACAEALRVLSLIAILALAVAEKRRLIEDLFGALQAT